ncbi:MAG: hypothetical protein H7250_12470 [Flavobacterium sp.]|nr:hypothetical protein [Flavobacterium sp.]
MENNKIITVIVDHLKAGYYESEIKDILKDENISENDFKNLFNQSKEIVNNDNIIKLAKKNKLKFFGYLSITVLTLLIFLFYLPKQIESPSTFYSIIGSAIICVFAFISFLYYKTWELEFVKEHEAPNINYSFLVIMILPCAILYFIISSVFENVADNMLKENQIEVVGKVISGGETEIQNRRGNIKISTIVVEFTTEEGKKVIASEEVDTYEFQGFYLNQEVNLIYSKTNPENINFLLTDADISKFKNSKEKEITPNDLIKLMSLNTKDIKTELNKISYGWEFNNQEMLWVNKRKNLGISINSTTVNYIGQNFSTADYFLKKNGFKRIDKIETSSLSRLDANKLYENNDYEATIKALPQGNGKEPLAITTITKK